MTLWRNYYIYEKGGLLVGRYLTLYENKIVFKKKISSQIEHSHNFFFKDANKFEVVSENNDSIIIKYSKNNLSNQIVFKK